MDELVEQLYLWVQREAAEEEFFLQWKYLINMDKLSKWMIPPFNEIWNFFTFRTVSQKNLDKVICALKLNGLFDGYCEGVKESHIKFLLIKMRQEKETTYKSLKLKNIEKMTRIDQLKDNIFKINNNLEARKKDLKSLIAKIGELKKSERLYRLLVNDTKNAIANIERFSATNQLSLDNINTFSDTHNKFIEDCKQYGFKCIKTYFAHASENALQTQGFQIKNETFENIDLTKLIKPIFLKHSEIRQTLICNTFDRGLFNYNFPESTLSLLPSLIETFNQRYLTIAALKESNLAKHKEMVDVTDHVHKLNIDPESSNKIINTLKLIWNQYELKEALQYFNSLNATLKISSVNYSNISARRMDSTIDSINSQLSKFNNYCNILPEIVTSLQKERQFYNEIKDDIIKKYSNISHLVQSIKKVNAEKDVGNKPYTLESATSTISNSSWGILIMKCIEVLKINKSILNKTFDVQLKHICTSLINNVAKSSIGCLMDNALSTNQNDIFTETSLSDTNLSVFINTLRCMMSENEEFQRVRGNIKSLIVKMSLIDDKLAKINIDLDEWWSNPAYDIFDQVLNRSLIV